MIGNSHDEHAMHEYQEEVVKIRERKEDPAVHGGGGNVLSELKNALAPGGEPHKEPEVGPKPIQTRTPGETDLLEALEGNLARPMYSTLIRYVYASPKESYDENFPRRAIFGAFNQYGAVDINSFKINFEVTVLAPRMKWPFIKKNIRKEYRKQRIWHDFQHREIPPHTFAGKLFMSYFLNPYFSSEAVHLNTRSLATLWHPPTYRVLTGPHMRRIESKKAGPPAGIEIFGDEKEIERYI
jgi:hypothetical protein